MSKPTRTEQPAPRPRRRKPTPEYSVRPAQPDDAPVWELVRSRGNNSSVITEYTSQAAAEIIAAALNTAAPYED